MATLASGASTSITLQPGQTVDFEAVGSGFVVFGPGSFFGQSVSVGPQFSTVGPFGATQILYVTAVTALSYQVNLSPGDAEIKIDNGGLIAHESGAQTANDVRTLTLETSLQQTILDQLPDGTYVGTANLPEAVGYYGSQLFLGTGSLSSLTLNGQLATRASGLKTSTGATITQGTVDGAWALPDNNVLFVIRSNSGATASKAYLYYAKNTGGTLTVGNNATAYDNGNAVLDIGIKSGTQPTNIRVLHNRSLCVATIAGATVLFLGEYNVAFGRVPGSTNDQVRVWRSNDLGKTWSVWLEFNTNGTTTQVRHIHGVVQDPATGYVYILCGDDPTSGIIRWDGVAATPPANTSLPDFNKYAGWHSLARLDGLTDNYRTGDLIFSGDIAGYLTDRAEVSTFWNATSVSRYGAMCATKGRKADLSAKRDPLIGVAVPGAGGFWFSMWDTSINGASRGFDVWSSPDLRIWQRIGYLADVGATGVTGVLSNVFWSNENKIVVSIAAGAARLVAGTNSYGGTLVFNADEMFDGNQRALS